MSPLDLAATRAALDALNTTGAPYRFAMDGTTVTGTWTVVDARFGSGDGRTAGEVERAFTVTVHLDPATGTYTVTEGSTGSSGYSSGVPSAMSGRSWSSSTTKGHVVKRTFGNVQAPQVESGDTTGTRVDYDAANRQMTGPLEEALASQGWTRKKGRLARLFGF